MALQIVATSLFALVMAVFLVVAGLPPVAYTIPARLVAFTDRGSGFGRDAAGPAGGTEETLAGLRPL